MKVPFGKVVNDVWYLSWEERLELLEYYVGASGHTDPDWAHEEFWDYVQHSEGRWLHKEFEPLPKDVEARFNEWVLEDENE